MVAGHYGVSFIAKAVGASIPLWVLFLAVQLVDILWAVLVLLRVERARVVPGITPVNPIDFYYMPYSHSLAAVIFWSIAALLAYRATARRQGWSVAAIVGGAVLSHWFLDFLVHRPILPLYDNTFKVGLGLYHLPALALGIEIVLLFGGIWLYLAATEPAAGARRYAVIVFGVALLGLLAVVAFGRPLRSIRTAAVAALVAYLGSAVLAYWLEKKRVQPRASASRRP